MPALQTCKVGWEESHPKCVGRVTWCVWEETRKRYADLPQVSIIANSLSSPLHMQRIKYVGRTHFWKVQKGKLSIQRRWVVPKYNFKNKSVSAAQWSSLNWPARWPDLVSWSILCGDHLSTRNTPVNRCHGRSLQLAMISDYNWPETELMAHFPFFNLLDDRVVLHCFQHAEKKRFSSCINSDENWPGSDTET